MTGAMVGGEDEYSSRGVCLVSYRSKEGFRPGIVVDTTVHDAAIVFDNPTLATVHDLVVDWPALRRDLLARVAGLPQAGLGSVDELVLDPPLRPAALYCAGANYTDHSANMASMLGITPDPPADQVDPWFFLKTPHCVAPPGGTVLAPSARLDWEGELAAVIGRVAHHVSPSDALRHVMGYTIANDLSARDRIKRRGAPNDSPFLYDFVGQKVFDGSCPLGPWIVPAEEIPDPQSLALRTTVNDVVHQDSSTAQMTYPVAALIAFLSSRLTLYPGDVILTGTPAGVGSERGQWLAPGDTVSVSIERIGTLTNWIA